MYCTLPSTVCVIEMWSFMVFLVPLLMVALPIVVQLALVKGVASFSFVMFWGFFCIFRHEAQQFHPVLINSGWLNTF